jgi:hypothetical protein
LRIRAWITPVGSEKFSRFHQDNEIAYVTFDPSHDTEPVQPVKAEITVRFGKPGASEGESPSSLSGKPRRIQEMNGKV